MKSLSLILLLALSATGSSLTKAQDALNKNDYEKAFTLLSPLAEDNNADAQFHLATLYFYGQGTKTDIKKAFSYYKLSAEQGQANAQYTLATKYCYGDHIKVDYTQCSTWALKAKESGKDVTRLWNHFELDKYLPTTPKPKR